MVATRNDDVTAADFAEYLTYEADTGRLIWHLRPARSKVTVGDEAGGVHYDGYRYFKFRGRLYGTHRVVWLMWHGTWPRGLLDHRDRVRNNNLIGNLRPATPTLNSRNTTSRKGSSSQYLGVTWNTQSQKWQAGIKRQGRSRHLGLFATEQAAALAYQRAARMAA